MSNGNKKVRKPRQCPEAPPVLSPFREKIHEIIFGADTGWGLCFDIVLLVAILGSIVVVCLESEKGLNENMYPVLDRINWAFTYLFTFEYLVRLYCVRRPVRYAWSFWGIIDLLSFLPDYILWLFPGIGIGKSFSVVRSLRLLRVFRVFRLGWFQGEADDLRSAIWRSRGKIIVFLATVLVIVTLAGTLMYEVEKNFAFDEDGNSTSQFHSIAEGIYWAIVTMTTVGFGDIVAQSIPGKFLSAFVILLGYSLIIVPTGFVSAEIMDTKRKTISSRSCHACLHEGHDPDAVYCKRCGAIL